MELKTVLTCPLGAKCEEARDGALHRCAWFVQLAGQNPQTGEQIDERGCAMSWLPVLLIENARVTRGTSAAVESFRNEMVKSTEVGQQMFVAAVQQQQFLK
jgi:hypothetical protein